MLNVFHNFMPEPVLLSLGPVNIYWYGLCIVLGVMAGIAVTLKIANRYGISQETVIDLALYLMVAGIIGARIYDVFLEIDYYTLRPLDILKIWQGGLAIHGAIIAGLLVIWRFAKKAQASFWELTDMVVPGLALGQAIGRWGNFFNQELFGRPTDLPWGITISELHRPSAFASSQYFHPTFLYESVGNLIIFAILFFLHRRNVRGPDGKKPLETGFITAIYLISYAVVRFSVEFIRIDATPSFLGLRFPQFMSILLVIAALAVIFRKKIAEHLPH